MQTKFENHETCRGVVSSYVEDVCRVSVFAECLTLGKDGLCRVPALPSAALNKLSLCRVPVFRHSAKSAPPVVNHVRLYYTTLIVAYGGECFVVSLKLGTHAAYQVPSPREKWLCSRDAHFDPHAAAATTTTTSKLPAHDTPCAACTFSSSIPCGPLS